MFIKKIIDIEFRKFGDLSKLMEHYEDLLYNNWNNFFC